MWEAFSAFQRSDISDLRYVVHSEISNTITKSIVDRAVRDRSKDVTVFKHGTEAYRAFLGTPNRVGSAYLLMEHKKRLHRKTIARIHAFATEIVPGIDDAPYIVYELWKMPVPWGPGEVILADGETNTSSVNQGDNGCASLISLVANV